MRSKQHFMRLKKDWWFQVAWIGMYNDWSSWSWSLQDTNFYQQGEADYKNWSPAEPNFYLGKVQCVEMYDSGQWNDVPCEWTRKPICAKVTGEADLTRTRQFSDPYISFPACSKHFDCFCTWKICVLGLDDCQFFFLWLGLHSHSSFSKWTQFVNRSRCVMIKVLIGYEGCVTGLEK